MRIVVHDYSGHPGQVHLSRELARRGHDVEHQFCTSYTTGRGATERKPGDPIGFSVNPIKLDREFDRYSPLVRLRQEFQYGRAAGRAIRDAKPDIAVLSNIPLFSLVIVTWILRLRRLPYVFWQQDVYSDAIGVLARHRFGWLGAPVAWIATRSESSVSRGAAAIVTISSTFTEKLEEWGVCPQAIHIIPNWAAIDEMPARPHRNEWAAEHGLDDAPVVMYAGTLGLKHNPSILAEIARTLPADARTVVVSQGRGRDWLESEASDVRGLMLLDYQPYEVLPEMLAAATVLVVLLEQDASRYSVPSKVLNYLCAGRPVLALLPRENAVGCMVEEAQAGLVVDPGDSEAVAEALGVLLSDPEKRQKMGRAAREFAERTFDVHKVGDHFESLLGEIVRCGVPEAAGPMVAARVRGLHRFT